MPPLLNQILLNAVIGAYLVSKLHVFIIYNDLQLQSLLTNWDIIANLNYQKVSSRILFCFSPKWHNLTHKTINYHIRLAGSYEIRYSSFITTHIHTPTPSLDDNIVHNLLKFRGAKNYFPANSTKFETFGHNVFLHSFLQLMHHFQAIYINCMMKLN